MDYTRAACGLKCNTDYIRNTRRDLTMQSLPPYPFVLLFQVEYVLKKDEDAGTVTGLEAGFEYCYCYQCF